MHKRRQNIGDQDGDQERRDRTQESSDLSFGRIERKDHFNGDRAYHYQNEGIQADRQIAVIADELEGMLEFVKLFIPVIAGI